MATNKAFLLKKLVNLKYKEGNSIAEYLNEMNSIINQLASMKYKYLTNTLRCIPQ